MTESGTTDPSGRARRALSAWPWLLLAVIFGVAAWHDLDFPDDVDQEFPGVARPTFSLRPPPAYRLAEPGDTIDRIGIYIGAICLVASLGGALQTRGRLGPWVAAVALSSAAFWYVASPGPTFDRWHGLGWRAMLDPTAPVPLRIALALALLSLGIIAVWGLRGSWGLWRFEPLALAAGVLAACRLLEFPDPEPHGYWPRWCFAGSLAAFGSVLVRRFPAGSTAPKVWLARGVVASGLWYALVVGGIGLTWYHRPLARLREVVPDRLFISAMPTARGLAVAQERHRFKTIINLFPEDTPLQSPRHGEEVAFAAGNRIRYVGSPADASESNDFLDLTLALAQDPEAWPILVHCHGCMDRTPAWVGIYQFVVEGRPLVESLRFIEQHRGYRPKASVTLLYNRELTRLAPERAEADPTARLLRHSARGVTDPYFRRERRVARTPAAAGASGVSGGSLGRLPSLTPRR